jgi:hypothetical protein
VFADHSLRISDKTFRTADTAQEPNRIQIYCRHWDNLAKENVEIVPNASTASDGLLRSCASVETDTIQWLPVRGTPSWQQFNFTGNEPGAVESKTSRRLQGVSLVLFTGFKCHKTAHRYNSLWYCCHCNCSLHFARVLNSVSIYNIVYRMHPVVYRILDYVYCDRQHNTFDVQLFIFYIIWLYYMFRPEFLVIIRYNMNTFQVVIYIGHSWLTNYCAVKISLRYLS